MNASPGRWVLFLLVIVACSGILIEFRSFGRDAAAMPVVFMAMKLLELKSQRDAVVTSCSATSCFHPLLIRNRIQTNLAAASFPVAGHRHAGSAAWWAIGAPHG